MATTLLFWDAKEKKVVEWDGDTYQGSIPQHLYMLNCLDLSYVINAPYGRYGTYLKYGWEHIPKKDFHPEFLLTLLLLGVQ